MSLTSDLNAIKTVQDGVKNNKVTRFAYTANAYANNDVDGHSDYVATRDNNIPLSDLSVIEVNQTVVDKGFRARASALNRMFLNHLFGRVSYNLNKINDLFNDLLVKVVANLGVPNGLATLDASGRIPYTQLPEDAMEYQGDWNAQTNTPTLADGTGTKGDTYNVSVGGTQDLGSGDIVFFAGDRVIYNGSVWQRASGGNVLTVSEIAPDEINGNVDLSKQTDVRKILSSGFLNKLYSTFIARVWVKMNIGEKALAFAEDNGTYYLVTNSKLYMSTDGINWTVIYNITTASSNITISSISLTANGGTVLFAYRLNSSPYSLFTAVRRSGEDSFVLTRIYEQGYSNTDRIEGHIFNGVILIGVYSSSNSARGIYRSTNFGVSYTRVLTASGYRITYNNGIYNAQTSNGFSYSNDGITWVRCTVSQSGYISNCPVQYINGLFLTGAQTGGYPPIWSEDGINWYTGTGDSPIGSGTANIFYVNGLFIAVELSVSSDGNDPTRIALRSSDGKNWSACSAPAITSGGSLSNEWYATNVIYEKGVYLMIARRNVIGLCLWYSYDAITWSHVNSPSSITAEKQVFWVTYINGIFVCIDTSGNTYRSTDGITWEEAESEADTTPACPAQTSRGTMFANVQGMCINASLSVYAPSAESYINGEQE